MPKKWTQLHCSRTETKRRVYEILKIYRSVQSSHPQHTHVYSDSHSLDEHLLAGCPPTWLDFSLSICSYCPSCDKPQYIISSLRAPHQVFPMCNTHHRTMLGSVSIIYVPHQSKPPQPTLIDHQSDWFRPWSFVWDLCRHKFVDDDDGSNPNNSPNSALFPPFNVNPNTQLIVLILAPTRHHISPSTATSHCCISHNNLYIPYPALYSYTVINKKFLRIPSPRYKENIDNQIRSCQTTFDTVPSTHLSVFLFVQNYF